MSEKHEFQAEVQQLLHLSRSQSLDKDRFTGTETDIPDLLQQVMGELVPLANSRDVDLTLEAPETAPAHVNADMLGIVLTNLIENAIKYAGMPGRVNVSLRTDAGSLSVLVEDSGPSLGPEEFQQAQEKFQRLGRGGNDGVGLGMAIVLELCQRLDLRLTRQEHSSLGGLTLRLEGLETGSQRN